MVYLVLPPIIIVASLLVLLAILSRKLGSVREEDLERMNEKRNGALSQKRLRWANFYQWLLQLLEKTIQRLKIYSLKIHNLSDRWFRSIKERRSNGRAGRAVDGNGVAAGNLKPTGELSVPEKKTGILRHSATRLLTKKKITVVSSDPKMSDGAIGNRSLPVRRAMPPKPPEEKKELEGHLIERIATDPRDIEAYERLGDYYLERGNMPDAKECFKQVLKMSPISRNARSKMRRIERKLGK